MAVKSREDVLLRRQKILADFGDFALQSEDLDEVLGQACRLVGDAMETGRAKVLQIEDSGKRLLVRAGVGWGRDVVGRVRISMDERSSESFSINERKPVISRDIKEEQRFDVPAFMKDAGVRALANVPIFLPGNTAFGLLQVDATEPRDFDQDDTEFLRTYATILGPIIDRILKLSALRSAEERFRLTVEEARDYAIFFTDADDRITDWLPGAKDVFGWSAQEAVGQPSAILFTPEDRKTGEDKREIKTARQEGVAVNVRWHMRKNGSRVFIEGSVRALRNAQGDVTGFIKIGQDVTEQREADARVRRSEERLRRVLDGMGEAFGVLAPDFTILEHNREALRLDGRTREEVVGRSHWEVYPGSEDAEVGRLLKKAMSERVPVVLEHQYAWKHGRARWLEMRAYPMDDGSLAVFWRDVTERREALEALRESEKRQRALIEGVPQLVWRAKVTGKWTWASPQWTDFTGQSDKESHGWGWLAALHPDDRKATRDAWSQAEERGGFEVEYRICHAADGQYRWFQTRATPVRDEHGAITEWLGTSTDIEDMRQMQDRQAVLVAELQHRTRNLMGVVRSTADRTMRKSADLASFKPAFRDRLTALARVQELLSRLTDWGRITFDELIATEIAALDGEAERVTLEGPSGVQLRSSTVQTLAIALHELATNALKYGALTQPGGHLTVRWHLEPKDRVPWLHVDWRETGVAMPPLDAPAQGSGMGRELIERALPHQLGAKTTFVMEADGVHCTIALPVSERTLSEQGISGEPSHA